MERKEVIDWLYRLKSHVSTFMPKIWHEKFIKALQFAIASLETDEAYDLEYENPDFCKDCISREQAIKEFCKQTCETPNCRFRDKGVVHASCDEVDVLKRLPSVLPKAKKGHWIKEDRGWVEYSAVCSECGDSTFWSEKSNFCPNCGANMREVEE